MTTHLLYLHGFRSSPRSAKATQTEAWIQAHAPSVTWWCPQLPHSPQEAIEMLRSGTIGWPSERMAIIGSSLGGFYATVMAEALGCPAALINPAVDPARDLARHLGSLEPWHGDAPPFDFNAGHVEALRRLTPPALTRLQRYFAVVATGDEVLDWREMCQRYRGAHLRVVEGSDHALSDFERHLPHVMHFLELGDLP